MQSASSPQSQRLGLRLVSMARALPAVLALAALAVPSRAATNLITNGNFESSVAGNVTVPPGGTAITGWTVGGLTGVYLVGTGSSLWPGNSSRWVDLTDSSYGGYVEQSFPTTAGKTYRASIRTFNGGLIFADGGPSSTAFSVSATGNGSVTFTNNPGAEKTVTYGFTATGSSTTLRITEASGRDTNAGWIDDVVVEEVPPPPVNWVNWTGTELVNGATTYVGQMVVPRTGGGSTTVKVRYTPPNQRADWGWPGICFPQFSNGTDYFAQGSFGALGRNAARSPYTSAKVPNIPDGGGAASDMADIITLAWAGTNKLEFFDVSTGQPIAIASPVFAYVSLNGNGYGFDQDFDILSFGDGVTRDIGFWGAGSSRKFINGAQYQLLQDVNPLGGGEPHGTLQFRGSFTTVTWQSLSNEAWNGFTIGVAQLAADAPIANAGPDATVYATSASGASVQLSGSAQGGSGSYTYSWTGPFGTVTGANPTVVLPVGTNTITLTVTDTNSASDSDTVVITVRPNPAPVITSPTTATGTYGSPFSYTITATNSPTSFGAANLPAGLTLSGAVISGTPTTTGLFSVNLSATNSGGTGTGSVLISIGKATPTVTVNGYTGVYDGNAHGATGTATGVGGVALTGLNLGATFTNVPGGTANWSFHDPAGNYADANGTASIVIIKANPTVVVTGYNVTYDGNPHTATGSATGVKGEALSGLNLSATTRTNAGTTSDAWTFTDSTGNYSNTAGSVTDVIAKAAATVSVTGYTGVYDGAAHGASGTAIGVNRDDLTSGLSLGATFTNAPGGSAHWTFTGGTNYADQSGDVTVSISKANATVVVASYSVTYDGNAHSASVTSITGVNGETGATVGTVNLTTTHTAAGTYADSWSFTGTANYNDIAATPITDTIAKATSTTTTVGAGPFTYDGTTHAGGSGTVSGAGTVTGAATVTYSGDQVNAGTYTVTAHYAGDANHLPSDGAPVTITINKATSTTTTVGAGPFAYDGTTHAGGSGTVAGAGTITGSATVTYSGDRVNAGSYTVTAHYAGDVNHTASDGTPVTITINKANAAVVVTPYSAEYDGLPHVATVTSITGVNGQTGAAVGTVTLNTTHTAVGVYATDSWSFTGTANYNNIAATTITDVIKDTTAPAITATMTPRGGGDDESSQFFTLAFSATDLAGVKTLTAVLNGVTVTNGQVVQLQTIKSGAQSVKRDDGKLQIKATSFALIVTATDVNGNTSTKTVVPVFVKNGKDDEDKKGGSSGSNDKVSNDDKNGSSGAKKDS